jgi:SPP1 gp7 family putative phage head morphogenesis protein
LVSPRLNVRANLQLVAALLLWALPVPPSSAQFGLLVRVLPSSGGLWGVRRPGNYPLAPSPKWQFRPPSEPFVRETGKSAPDRRQCAAVANGFESQDRAKRQPLPSLEGGKPMSLFARIKAVWDLAGIVTEQNGSDVTESAPVQEGVSAPVQKGAIAPFDRIIDTGALVGGQKLSQPYKQSAPVMRALKLVSQPISQVPLRFTVDRRDGKQLVENPELAAWWETPAVGADKQPMSQADFIEASVGWLKLKGECFWIIDDTVLQTANLPFPEVGVTFPRLIIARPERMRPIKYKGDSTLLGWEFTDGAGRRFTFMAPQVIHLRLWNPYDDCRGLGEVESVKIDAESDWLAAIFKRNLWRGNGDRGPIISVKNALTLGDTQREQLIQQFREKREMASRGIFKAAVVGGDISVEDPKAQTVDAAYIASRQEDIVRIFIGLGVPPSMATVTASYSIGSASDWYRLIIDTCLPAGKKLSEGFERVLKMQTGQTLFAWFEWRAHPVMQQVRKESVDSGTKLWDRGMPWEAVNEWLDLGLPKFDGWEIGYMPFSVSPVGADGALEPEPTKDPALNEPLDTDNGSKAAARLQRLLRGRAAGPPGSHPDPRHLVNFEPIACGLPEHDQVKQKARSAKEVALWKVHMSRRRVAMKRFAAAFNKELIKARARVLSNIAAKLDTEKSAAPVSKAAAADFLFDLPSFKSGLLSSMRKASLGALQEAGQQFFAEIKKDDPFRYPPAKAVEFVRDRENKLSGVPQDVFDRIKSAVETGLDKGESIEKLSDRLRSEFNALGKDRARVIAMTETASAYGAARQEAMEQSGVEFKKWLTSGAATVRPAHAAANGQTVRVDEPFEVGGESLEGPGDPNGSPGNVINCHCVAIAVAAPEEET